LRNVCFEVCNSIKQTYYYGDCQRQQSTYCGHRAEPRLNQGLAARCGHLHLSVGQSEGEGLLRDLNRIWVVRDVTTTPEGANSPTPSLWS
jgi:hypothetical protein